MNLDGSKSEVTPEEKIRVSTYRQVCDLVDKARKLGLEKDAANINPSMGISDIRWAELRQVATAIKDVAGTKSIALLAIEVSDLELREKVVLAFMIG